MSINIKTIARKSKVSIATVSRVINSSGYVSAEAVRNVRNAIQELGYSKNKVASNLRKQNTCFIGLIVPDISNEYFATLAMAIENCLQEKGFSLFLCNTQESIAKEQFYLQSLLENKVDALIIASAEFDTIVQDLEKIDIPIVFVDRIDHSAPRENTIYIESDNLRGAETATDALLKKGTTRFLYLRDVKEIFPEKQRQAGFLQSMQKHAVDKKDYKIKTIQGDSRNALQAIKDIYSDFKFNGVFCSNDKIAIGALKGLLDLGLAVPETIQVVGFDGMAMGEYFTPAISTIRQDTYQMGQLVAEKIIQMILKEKINERHMIIPTQFIERQTTK